MEDFRIPEQEGDYIKETFDIFQFPKQIFKCGIEVSSIKIYGT